MDLHENQCGQPKHEIDAAGCLGRGGSREEVEEEEREEQVGVMEDWRKGGGAEEFSEVHKSGLLSS